MSVTKHDNQHGCTIRCNGARCPQKITTGQVTIKAIRGYAKSIGWERAPQGDLCAECGASRREAREARIARRDELRRMTPDQRRAARNEQDRNRRAAKRVPAQVAA